MIRSQLQIRKFTPNQNVRRKWLERQQCSATSTKPKSSPFKKFLLLVGVGGALVFVLQQNRKEEEKVEEIFGLNYLEDAMTTNNLDISPWQIPHDEKKHKGGEDTVCIFVSFHFFFITHL